MVVILIVNGLSLLVEIFNSLIVWGYPGSLQPTLAGVHLNWVFFHYHLGACVFICRVLRPVVTSGVGSESVSILIHECKPQGTRQSGRFTRYCGGRVEMSGNRFISRRLERTKESVD